LVGLQSHWELQGDFCYEASVNPKVGTTLVQRLNQSHISFTLQSNLANCN